MPAESDDEDWYERRRRLDTHERLFEAGGYAPSFGGGSGVHRAGLNGGPIYVDGDLGDERPYRPAGEGKQLRVPVGDARRTLLRPAEIEDYQRYNCEVPQRLVAERQRALADAAAANRLVGAALQPGEC